jgi:hypothetical protein
MDSTVGGPRKVLLVAGGALVVLAGVALLFLPGPGIPLIIAGLAMIGQVVPSVRRLERKLRDRARRALGRDGGRQPEPAVKSSERPLLS